MRNEPRFQSLGNRESERAELGWWHSFHFPDGEHIAGVRTESDLRAHLARFAIPPDLHGQRVLDIGTWDGWFSFELEQRGAGVTAIDCWDNPRFRYAHRKLASRVHYLVRDIYDLTPRDLGQFDLVLFFGVLYHLKHPLLGLERVCALTRGSAFVETFVTDTALDRKTLSSRPVMEFYETGELSGQLDNWTGSNTSCLLAFCRTAGFASVDLHAVKDHRAYLTCQRSGSTPDGPALTLVKVAHSRNGGINFDSRADEYVSAWFTSQSPVTIEHVRPVAGPFGSPPILLRREGDAWLTQFKLPPGLAPGWHDVRLGTRSAFPIAVDVPVIAPGALTITGLSDGHTWEAGVAAIAPSGGVRIALWVEGLPPNADTNNTIVSIAGRRSVVDHLEPGANTSRQVNTVVDTGMEPGACSVTVECGGAQSAPVSLRVI